MGTEGNDPSSLGKIGLVLSGGGVRAAVFHLGVLRLLADRGALERVSVLSTVSGGSLVSAAVITASSMRWPGSSLYRERIFPELRQLLTTRDLFSLGALGWRGVARHRSRLLHHRAEILTDLLDRQWNIKTDLNDLPETPTWWINTTCIETGKNWRFSKREMGDWRFGRHYEPRFPLARAVAASAAVPYAIGALRFDLPKAGWYRTDPATRKPLEAASPSLAAVNLWDGGAYENLGLEPVYKIDRGLVDCDFLICSDASGPLGMASPTPPLANLLKGRLATPRLFSIASDQIRALRSRMLVGAIMRGEVQGVLVRMGNSNRNLDLKAGRNASPSDYDAFSSEENVDSVANYPTDLNAVTTDAFDRISRHGYEVAERTLTNYHAAHFPAPLQTGT
ncbi:MAG: patatin-like phospholipase family protein [Proteobacteria bacterium]|nr:patatin-like phospholipase family protein [Pseudomonadota bacterium]